MLDRETVERLLQNNLDAKLNSELSKYGYQLDAAHINRVLCALIENQIEAANQICWDKSEISRRCNRQQHLLCTAIKADLKRICKLVHLEHGSRNADLTQHRQTAESRLFKRHRAECNQRGKRKFLGHADTLQIPDS